ADVLDDPRNCGSCQNDCTVLLGIDPTTVSCVNGTCRYTCKPGNEDLDTNPGCESTDPLAYGTNNLVLWLKETGNVGGQWTDASPYNNSAYCSYTTQAQGPGGRTVMQYDGSNSYCQLPAMPAPVFATGTTMYVVFQPRGIAGSPG